MAGDMAQKRTERVSYGPTRAGDRYSIYSFVTTILRFVEKCRCGIDDAAHTVGVVATTPACRGPERLKSQRGRRARLVRGAAVVALVSADDAPRSRRYRSHLNAMFNKGARASRRLRICPLVHCRGLLSARRVNRAE